MSLGAHNIVAQRLLLNSSSIDQINIKIPKLIPSCTINGKELSALSLVLGHPLFF